MEAKACLGAFVEIKGAVASTPIRNLGGDLFQPCPSTFNGTRGYCADFLEADNAYSVLSFLGEELSVPEDVLEIFEPEPAEKGGFDVVWPNEEEAVQHFGRLVSECLANKGYCVVQKFGGVDECPDAALREAETVLTERMKKELEVAYLGFENTTRVAFLELDDPDKEVGSSLEACDRRLTDLASILAPFSENLNFSAHSRSGALIRLTGGGGGDEADRDALADATDGEIGQHVGSYIRFVRRRRLCLMYWVKNSGGEVWLHPKKDRDQNGDSVRLPLQPGKVLVFQHDRMEYSYQPAGRSLAIQAWVLDDSFINQKMNHMEVSFNGRTAIVNPGPAVPSGPKANVMAMSSRFPDNVWSPDALWAAVAAGADGITKHPISRWDVDLYCELGCDTSSTGKSYTIHGGFLSEAQEGTFDHDFFGIGADEAATMLCSQRMVMEVGYECLHKAGFRQESLKGAPIGAWFGDCGPDWHGFQTEWPILHKDKPASVMATMSTAVTSSRLSYMYGMRGPTSSYDTACSASLVACNAAHLTMFDTDAGRAESSQALVMGVNVLLHPASFIGNCLATMLSRVGRCFTFNQTADGYQRGEGVGALFMRRASKDDKIGDEDRIAALIGTATNQDGRSASLTAPNGPAQQQVIRKSMRFAGIDPNTVSIAECHGTGTPLGDPIEIGSLMAVMHKRSLPILKTSAKTNIGHLEGCAGMAGLQKCVAMIGAGCAPPNCHLAVLNAHLTTEGYPVYFDSELIDTGISSCYCGVSSFGFGGTNSRADVYGFAARGPNAAIKVQLPPLAAPRGFRPYGLQVYIRGSWSRMEEFEAMEEEEGGAHVCEVVLGDTRREFFQLSLSNTDDGFSIHPVSECSVQSTSQVVGPDPDGEGKNFVLDGRLDGAPVGAVYRVVFDWADGRKGLRCECIADRLEVPATDVEETERPNLPLGWAAEHTYQIAGSWNRWSPQQMQRGSAGGTVYQASFIIGPRFEEEFKILRDADWGQVFYPATSHAEGGSAPVLGPDDADNARRWVVRGAQHDRVTVTLELKNGDVTVSAAAASFGKKVWECFDQWACSGWRRFHVVGSFNNWLGQAMEPDMDIPGLYRLRVQLGAESSNAGMSSFRISVDGDQSLQLYPDAHGFLQGPGDATSFQGRSWSIPLAMAAGVVEIVFDMRRTSRTSLVSWHFLAKPLEDIASAPSQIHARAAIA